MNPVNAQEPNPQAVQNTLHAWLTLEAMSRDRATYPTLAAEMREAVAKVDAALWKKAAQDLGFNPLQAVEPLEGEADAR